MRRLTAILSGLFVFYGMAYLAHIDPYGDRFWFTLPTAFVGVLAIIASISMACTS